MALRNYRGLKNNEMIKTKEQFISEYVRQENLEKVNKNTVEVHHKESFYEKYIKRILDIIISLPANIVLLPIYIVLSVLVYFDLGFPIVFKQKRTGKDGKEFFLIKFRSMTNRKDKNGNLLPEIERTTKFGQFIRRYSLDELISIWLILKGDLSIIGPRPLPVTFEERYSKRHKMRSTVKPGLECASINSDGHIRLYQEQFENDIWYVENISFRTDCKMFWGLIKMVFNHKERTDHAQVGGGAFIGYDENGQAFSMRRIPPKYEELYKQYLEKNEI